MKSLPYVLVKRYSRTQTATASMMYTAVCVRLYTRLPLWESVCMRVCTYVARAKLGCIVTTGQKINIITAAARD